MTEINYADGKKSPDDITSYLRTEEDSAREYQQQELQPDRERNLNYLLGRKNGTEEENRSQVISTDVWDAINGMLPSLLKPFTSTDDYVQFSPVSEDDEPGAEQETDYLNFVVSQKNNGYMLFYNWFLDALLNKYGIVEYLWEESNTTTVEKYTGLTDEELAMLVQNEGVEIEEQSSYPDEFTIKMQQQQQQPQQQQETPMAHDVTVRVRKSKGEAKIHNIPPEEFLFNSDLATQSIKDATFVQREVYKTISTIREMGYDIPDDIDDDAEDFTTYSERQNRHDSYRQKPGVQTDDAAGKMVLFKVSHCMYDLNGDGITELVRIVRVGDNILEIEEVEEIPYSVIHCHIMPHKFAGVSSADVVAPIQDLKTSLWRQALDNVYSINSNRVFVSNRVDLDDMLSNPLGGIVRVDAETAHGHVSPAPITPIIGVLQPMIEYADSVKENRTGFTRYSSGMDANSLNKTATGVSKIMEAAAQRMELMARTFAETGVKDLMLGLHGLVKRNSVKEDVFRLRNKWVTVDPRQWRTRTDMTVSVGLGTGDRQQQIQQMQMLGMAQEKVVSLGLADRKTMYNVLRRGVEAMGYKDVSQFFIEPEDGKMPPPQPDPKEANAKAELELKKVSAQQDMELDKQKLQHQIQMENAKVQAAIRTEEAKTAVQLEKLKVDAQVQMEKETYKRGTELAKIDAVDNPPHSAVIGAISQLAQQVAGMKPVGLRQIKDESGRLIGAIRIAADGTETEITID
tara:strand:- start:92 stop:2314 length:2223 start_codon:yes stop_codon:yes gene_type:complete